MVPSRPELIEAIATGEIAYATLAPIINHEFCESFRSNEYIDHMKSKGATQNKKTINANAFPRKIVERSARTKIQAGVADEEPIPIRCHDSP